MLAFLQFLVIFLPFQFALNIFESADIAFGRVLILIIFLFWLVYSFKKNDLKLPFSLPAFFLYFFLFFCLFSLANAEMISWGLRKAFFLINAFLIFFVVFTLGAKKENAEKIIKSFVLAAGLVSITGFLQFFSQFIFGLSPVESFYKIFAADFFWGKNFGAGVTVNPSWFVEINGKPIFRAISAFPDPHNFAMFLGVLFPIVASYWFYLKKIGKPYLFQLFTALFSVILIFLSFSRGAYLGFLFSFFAVFWLFRREKIINLKLLFAILAICAIFLLVVPNPLTSRFFSSFDFFNEGSAFNRLLIWQEALQVIKNNFIFGVGLGNYSLVKAGFIGYRDPSNAHNLYLDIWAEAGIFALLSFVLLFGFLFKDLIKNIKEKSGSSDFAKFLSIGFIGSFIYFLVHSFFETVIFSPVNLPALMILMALSSRLNYFKN